METSHIFVNRRSGLRAGWRILLYIALTVVCSFAVLSLYSTVVTRIAGAAAVSSAGPIPQYVLLSATALIAAFLMLRFLDRRPSAALGFAFHGRVWLEVGQGIFQGFVMVSSLFLVEWGAGWVGASRAGLSAPAGLRFFVYYVVLFALAGTFEEIATRGYAFQALVQGTGKTPAVCISSLIFGLGHAANPHASAFGILNTMLAGVWLSVAYLKTRSLWMPTSLHLTWNLTLGFVYGFPISGVPLPQSVVRLSEHGPAWLTGGDYGPEAGAVTSLVLILATVYLWRSDRVRPAQAAIALWHTPEPDQLDD
jgi:membrane protease YdiL (CAAX protease family)